MLYLLMNYILVMTPVMLIAHYGFNMNPVRVLIKTGIFTFIMVVFAASGVAFTFLLGTGTPMGGYKFVSWAMTKTSDMTFFEIFLAFPGLVFIDFWRFIFDMTFSTICGWPLWVLEVLGIIFGLQLSDPW